jgi:hypothetical protein
MKRCPQCQQTFSDDNFYCLSDGTPLPAFSDATEAETVVRSAPVVQPTAQTTRQGVNPLITYLSIGFLASLVIIGGAIILFLLLKSNTNTPPAKNDVANIVSNTPEPKQTREPDTTNQQKANLEEQQASLEKEKQKLADERRKLDAQKIKPVEPSINTPAAQPTARISFQRVSTQSTVSGVVASERSYVLAARSGQYLSATVSSGSGCVALANGSTSIGYTTSKGDNRVTVVNKCGGQSSFNLTVSIR